MLNPEITKLNLGCGNCPEKLFPRPWWNVDLENPLADEEHDARALPLEWTARFFEVRASHILEHTFIKEWPAIIQEWCRVLRPGGILRIIVPDLDIVLRCLQDGVDMKGRRALSLRETTAALAQLYGIGYDDPSTDARWRHRIIVSGPMLADFLSSLGCLENIAIYKTEEDPAAVHGIRDDSQNPFSVHVVARKPHVKSDWERTSSAPHAVKGIRNSTGQLLCFRHGSRWEPALAQYPKSIPGARRCEFLFPEELEYLSSETSAPVSGIEGAP